MATSDDRNGLLRAVGYRYCGTGLRSVGLTDRHTTCPIVYQLRGLCERRTEELKRIKGINKEKSALQELCS